MGVHGSGRNMGLDVPDVFEKTVSGLHAIPSFNEGHEQAKLEGRQVDLSLVDPDAVGLPMDLQGSKMARLVFRRGRLRLCPSEQSPDTQDQFPYTERLGDVVVRPQLEADDSVDFLSARAQDHDGQTTSVWSRSECPTDVIAGHVGEHEVKEDEMRACAGDQIQAFSTVGRGHYVKSFCPKIELEVVYDVFLVFNDNNLCHEDGNTVPL